MKVLLSFAIFPPNGHFHLLVRHSLHVESHRRDGVNVLVEVELVLHR